MIKEYNTHYNQFMFNNNIIFFLDRLVNKKRFIGKIEFQIITENKLYNITIEDLFDYLFIYKKFNQSSTLNIIKKYYIHNILLYEKSVSLFLPQLEIMVNIFQEENIGETFENIVKYKLSLDK